MLGRILLMVVVMVLVMMMVGVLVAVDRDERKAEDDVLPRLGQRVPSGDKTISPLDLTSCKHANVIFTHKETRLRRFDCH
jgi:hypothetical protein